MIITRQKHIDDIKKHLAGDKAVFVMGCGECSATCKTGGEPEVAGMKTLLESLGYKVTGTCVPEAPCIASKVRVVMAKNKKAIDEADSIVILACGLGAQSVKQNQFSDKTVHIGCDTLFMGQVEKDGSFSEVCSACGECLLDSTEMICPVTRCPKSLLNGPCGGQKDGKCEVNRDRDCAWIMIYEALKKKNKLHLIENINLPKAHSKSSKPRQYKA